jgi:hypothetical protein
MLHTMSQARITAPTGVGAEAGLTGVKVPSSWKGEGKFRTVSSILGNSMMGRALNITSSAAATYNFRKKKLSLISRSSQRQKTFQRCMNKVRNKPEILRQKKACPRLLEPIVQAVEPAVGKSTELPSPDAGNWCSFISCHHFAVAHCDYLGNEVFR